MNALPTLSDKPAGSNIEEAVDLAGVTLSWRPQPVRPDLRSVAFFVVWLCGWLVSFVYAVFCLLSGEAPIFLVIWLGVWTIAGGLTIRGLWALLRPPPAESIRLAADVLQYDSGRKVQAWDKATIDFTRSNLYGVVLERVEKRERLCLDLGDGWFEIGASLQDPDRKWMFAVLQNWYGENKGAQTVSE